MIEEAVKRVAFDSTVSDDEIVECCVFLERSIVKARKLGEPAPFADHRNLRIFKMAMDMREQPSAIRGR